MESPRPALWNPRGRAAHSGGATSWAASLAWIGRDRLSLALLLDETNVAGAQTTASRIILDVEFDLLPLLQGVELAGAEGGMVEKDLIAVVGANEAETPVSNQANHWPCRHGVVLLCWTLLWRASTRPTDKSMICLH